jgi:hypothetical protein
VSKRDSLRLRPNDNVGSVLARSQKPPPVGEFGQQCDLSLNNRDLNFHDTDFRSFLQSSH